MMTVYHGSAMEVKKPDTQHSSCNLDFGKGFYVTSSQEQAERWAMRKAAMEGAESAIVNVYEMRQIPDDVVVKSFPEDLSDWIDFVCACRDGQTIYEQFDIVCGKVANDRVYRVVDFYKNGIWDKARAIREIRAYEHYDQTAFINQEVITRLLQFKKSYRVMAFEEIDDDSGKRSDK